MSDALAALRAQALASLAAKPKTSAEMVVSKSAPVEDDEPDEDVGVVSSDEKEEGELSESEEDSSLLDFVSDTPIDLTNSPGGVHVVDDHVLEREQQKLWREQEMMEARRRDLVKEDFRWQKRCQEPGLVHTEERMRKRILGPAALSNPPLRVPNGVPVQVPVPPPMVGNASRNGFHGPYDRRPVQNLHQPPQIVERVLMPRVVPRFQPPPVPRIAPPQVRYVPVRSPQSRPDAQPLLLVKYMAPSLPMTVPTFDPSRRVRTMYPPQQSPVVSPSVSVKAEFRQEVVDENIEMKSAESPLEAGEILSGMEPESTVFAEGPSSPPKDELAELAALKKAAAESLLAKRRSRKSDLSEEHSEDNDSGNGESIANHSVKSVHTENDSPDNGEVTVEAAAFLSSLSMLESANVVESSSDKANDSLQGHPRSEDVQRGEEHVISHNKPLISPSNKHIIGTPSAVEKTPEQRVEISSRSTHSQVAVPGRRFSVARKPSDPFVIYLENTSDDEDHHSDDGSSAVPLEPVSELDRIRSTMIELKKRIAAAEAKKLSVSLPASQEEVCSSKKRSANAYLGLTTFSPSSDSAIAQSKRLKVSRASTSVVLTPESDNSMHQPPQTSALAPDATKLICADPDSDELRQQIFKESKEISAKADEISQHLVSDKSSQEAIENATQKTAEIVIQETTEAVIDAVAQQTAEATSEYFVHEAAEAVIQAVAQEQAHSEAEAAYKAAARQAETLRKRKNAVNRRIVSIAKLQSQRSQAEKRRKSFQTRLKILQSQVKRMQAMIGGVDIEVAQCDVEISQQQNELEMLRRVMRSDADSVSPQRKPKEQPRISEQLESPADNRRMVDVNVAVDRAIDTLSVAEADIGCMLNRLEDASPATLESRPQIMVSPSASGDLSLADFPDSSDFSSKHSTYLSPLRCIRSYRLSSHFDGDISSPAFRVFSGRACLYDLLGQCNDDNCSGIHLDAQRISDHDLKEDVLTYLRRLRPDIPSDHTAPIGVLLEEIRQAVSDPVHVVSSVCFSSSGQENFAESPIDSRSTWPEKVPAQIYSRQSSLAPEVSPVRPESVHPNSAASGSDDDFLVVPDDGGQVETVCSEDRHQALLIIDSVAARVGSDSQIDADAEKLIDMSLSESRYFSDNASDQSLRERQDVREMFTQLISTGTHDVRTWLAFARWTVLIADGQSISSGSSHTHWLDECLHVLTRSLEAQPHSPPLWWTYLSLVELRGIEAGELSSMLRSAVHYCPLDVRLWLLNLSAASNFAALEGVVERALLCFESQNDSIPDCAAYFFVRAANVFLCAGRSEQASSLLSSLASPSKFLPTCGLIYIAICSGFLLAHGRLPQLSFSGFESTLDCDMTLDHSSCALKWHQTDESRCKEALAHWKSVISSLTETSRFAASREKAALNVFAWETVKLAAKLQQVSLVDVVPEKCISILLGLPRFDSWAVVFHSPICTSSSLRPPMVWATLASRSLSASYSDAKAVICRAAHCLSNADLSTSCSSSDNEIRQLLESLSFSDVYVWYMRILFEGLCNSDDSRDRIYDVLQQALLCIGGADVHRRGFLYLTAVEVVGWAGNELQLQEALLKDHLKEVVALSAANGTSSDAVFSSSFDTSISRNIRSSFWVEHILNIILPLMNSRRRIVLLQSVLANYSSTSASVSVAIRLCSDALAQGQFHVAYSAMSIATSAVSDVPALWMLLCHVNICRGRIYAAIEALTEGLRTNQFSCSLYNQLLHMQKEWLSDEAALETEQQMKVALLSAPASSLE